MHTYSMDNNLRSKIIVSIFTLSIILSSVLTMIFENVISKVLSWVQTYDCIATIMHLCSDYGVTTNYIGIPFLYSLLYFLFTKYIWRWKCVNKILNVPDLNGHWTGKLTSVTFGSTIDMDLDIKQTWGKISFVSTFAQSKSESNTASVFIERDGIAKVGFGFINHSRELPHQYDGYNVIDIDNATHLFGRYFNNRDNTNAGHKGGNMGTFELEKQG